MRWDEGRTNRGANPWAAGTSKDIPDEVEEVDVDGDSVGGKKKKGKKQVVYKFG